MATLANAAVYETGPNTNDPLHKINEYYGHSLSLSNHELSLIAGDGTTSLGSIGLVSKSSDGLTPQLPNENTVSKFLRQDGTWAGGSIPVAEVDSTSTSTAFTAQIPEFTDSEYKDHMIFILHNNTVTSASGCTLNINGLGAVRMYSATTTGVTGVTNDFTLYSYALFIYDAITNGGCWKFFELKNYKILSYTAGWIQNGSIYSGRLYITGNLVPSTTIAVGSYSSASAASNAAYSAAGSYFLAASGWKKITSSTVGLSNVTNVAQIAKSIGTTKGDMIYYTASSSPARLGIGTTGQVLKVSSSGIPAWENDNAATLGHTLTIGSYTFDGSADVSIPIYNGTIV